MKNKKVLIICLIILNFLVLGVHQTIASYKSSKNTTATLEFAKIVFNNQETSNISLTFDGLSPNDSIDYSFEVKNNLNGIQSEVNVEYDLIITTFFTIPFQISLYKDSQKIYDCDSSNAVLDNSTNIYTCTVANIQLPYASATTHNYILRISYLNGVSADYADKVDFVDIKIDSRQKV